MKPKYNIGDTVTFGFYGERGGIIKDCWRGCRLVEGVVVFDEYLYEVHRLTGWVVVAESRIRRESLMTEAA